MRLPTFNILTLAALTSLVACDHGPTKARLESDVRRLQDENKQLQIDATNSLRTQQQAAALTEEVRRLQTENATLKGQLTPHDAPLPTATEQSPSQSSQDSKPKRIIDPEQYKAQLDAIKGWTKQQVVAKFGKPHGTDEGGQFWFYKFDAQDKFGVIYRHIQINFDDSGLVNLTTIGQSSYLGSP